MSFKKFNYVRAVVEAVKYTKDSYKDIVDVLTADLAEGKIVTFNVSQDSDNNAVIVYRYNSDTVDTTLEIGDYLVKYADGEVARWSADDFEAAYVEAEDQATADDAKADESTVNK